MIVAKRLPTSRSRPRSAHREVHATFHGLTFTIDPGRAFTPRATTERLVDAALARVAGRSVRLADVGTGVGVVAITLALRAPNAEVWASDTSDRALELTAANAKRLGAQINLVHGDLLEHVPTNLDLIVANLPHLSPGTAGYDDEPKTSVFSTGDGLDHYRRLLTAARDHVVDDGGVLIQFDGEVLEAHRSQLRELRATLEARAAGRGALGRVPLPFETSVPGVFAVGDVRHGSMKRVAAEVGEGASAVRSVHTATEVRE
jgi:HemK-like putative methylase